MKVLCYATFIDITSACRDYLGEHIYVDKWHTTWKAAIGTWQSHVSEIGMLPP